MVGVKQKGYLFQLAKLWKELVVLTAKLKKAMKQCMQLKRRNEKEAYI